MPDLIDKVNKDTSQCLHCTEIIVHSEFIQDIEAVTKTLS